MPRIITVTPNTAIDNLIRVDRLRPGHVMEARSSHRYPAGKGVNVARTAASLGEAVTVLGLVGTASAALFDALQSDLTEVKFISVPGETRTNISISASNGSAVTHIRTAGYRVSDDDMERLANLLRQTVKPGDVVVLAGSLPREADSSTYAILADLCVQAGARVILDTSGPPLKAGIKGRPYMMKPNTTELEDLTDRTIPAENEQGLKTILAGLEIPVPLMVLSRGAAGILVRQQGDPVIRKVSVPSAEGKRPVNNVGCGDALVGGFAVGLIRRQSLEETIRLGVACGTANLFTEIPGLCDPEIVHRLAAKVRITELS